jgi:cystathionine gamma-synthase/methionine-gamma-lyase
VPDSRPTARLHFDTLAVHAGASSATFDGAHPTAPPIVNATGFWYESADPLDAVLGGEQPGYVYGRFANPTVAAFEHAVAELEQAVGAVAFASGMAALHAAVTVCAPGPGSTVFASLDCYGGTSSLLTGVVRQAGVQVEMVDVFDLPALEARLAAARPAALLFEVISNPLQRVADLPAIVALARRYGVRTLIDSTFTTPVLVRPLALGADFVIHSATKYLGGHGDVTAGVVACADPDLLAAVRGYCQLVGGILGPTEAYLALRGLRTLGLRMARQCANACALAERFAADGRIKWVHFPGLPDSPDYPTARRLFPEGLYGATLAIAIQDAGRAEAMQFMERLRLLRPAPTLGDCESLVLYPAIASHRGLTAEERAARGIHDNVVRLALGIEAAEDLWADVDQALG